MRVGCALACAASLALAAPAPASVTLQSGAGDLFVLGCPSPPGIERHPSDPEVAFVACTSFTKLVAPYRIAPDEALDEELALPLFLLPADLNGSLPNPPDSVFIDDVWIESSSFGWITTSGHETVAVYDPAAGTARSVLYAGISRVSVPTKRTLTGSFTRSNGTAISTFSTNFTSGVLRVGDRLLVTTSNFHAVGSNPVLNPGTLLLFDVDDSNPAQLVVTDASPPYLITSEVNSTDLALLPGGLVAVTNTGVLALSNPPSASGPASIDIVDPQAGAILVTIPLGNAGLAFRRLAADVTGSVGVIGSGVLRQLFAVDLRGLAALPIPAGDPTLQRPSCNGAPGPDAGGIPCHPERVIAGVANPISIPPCASGCSGATDGFVAAVRFGASGDFVVATEFNDGLAAFAAFDPRNLATPNPLLRSRFGDAQSLSITPPSGTFGQETGPGPMLLVPPPGGGLAGSDLVWVTDGPSGALMRATAGGSLAVPTGNADGDAVEDALDVCPLVADVGADSGGVGGAVPDGAGDVCQCGDVNGDGQILIDDAVRIARTLVALPPALPFPDRCNVTGKAGGGSGTCEAADPAAIRQGLAGEVAAVRQICDPALP